MKGIGVSWGRAELKAGGASALPNGELTAGGVSWGRAELKAGGKAAVVDRVDALLAALGVVTAGLGRTATAHHRPPTPYQIRKHVWYLSF